MKAKKALKRLNKVEVLLTDVMDEFPGSKAGLAELLGSAKTVVVHAQKTVNSQLKRPPAKAGKAQTVTAKKRSAVTTRKGVNSTAGRSLGKTA